MMKRIEQVDTETGEVLGGAFVYVPVRHVSPFKRHITMNQDTLITVAKELNPEQLRVWLVLVAKLDYENYILVSQKEIIELLGMLQPHVSRAVKGLVKHGVILEGAKVGNNKSYRLNPLYGWKGKISNHAKALKAGLSVIEGGKA